MTNLLKLPTFSADGNLRVVIETPRGSRAKVDYDPKLKTFTLSKALLAGLTYPYDWGFVPATRCQDGDPLDVMVMHEAATFPGLVLNCKIIGVCRSSSAAPERSRSATIACSPSRGIRMPTRTSMMSATSRAPSGTNWKSFSLRPTILGWKGPKTALKTIKRAKKAFGHGK